MKKLSYRFFGILLCVSVLFCGFGTEHAHGSVYRFTDIGFSQSWCYTEYLIYAVKHSLLFGTSETTVSPNRRITWGEMITILGRVHESVSGEQLPQTAGKRFYSRYVSWAKSSGLLKNIKATADLAEQSVTREQTATLLCNYLDCFGLWREFPVPSETVYRDLNEASPVAAAAIGRLEGFQVFDALDYSTTREELLSPQKLVTRREAVGMLVRFYQKLTCPIDRETRRVKYAFYLDGDYSEVLDERLPLSPYGEVTFLTSFQEYGEYLNILPKPEIREDGTEYYPFLSDKGERFAYAEREAEGAPLIIDEQLFESCNIAAVWINSGAGNLEQGELACEISEKTVEIFYVLNSALSVDSIDYTYPQLNRYLYLVAVPKTVTRGTREPYWWVQEQFLVEGYYADIEEDSE